MSHDGLGDYLDGYEEFLDEHDRRSLGLAPTMQVVQPRQQAFVPSQKQQFTPVVPRTTFVPQSSGQKQQLTPFVPLTTFVPPSDPVRLRAAMLPAGRVMTVPFAQTSGTLLNPGVPVPTTPAGMPMTPMTMSAPSQGDTPIMIPDQTGSTPTSQPMQSPSTYGPYGPNQGTQSTQTPNDGSSSSGTFGISTTTWGWLALLGGAYWIYRNVKE